MLLSVLFIFNSNIRIDSFHSFHHLTFRIVNISTRSTHRCLRRRLTRKKLQSDADKCRTGPGKYQSQNCKSNYIKIWIKVVSFNVFARRCFISWQEMFYWDFFITDNWNFSRISVLQQLLRLSEDRNFAMLAVPCHCLTKTYLRYVIKLHYVNDNYYILKRNMRISVSYTL